MASNGAITRAGQRKLNPINVKDKEVQNNLELVNGNFSTIFNNLGRERVAFSEGIGLNTAFYEVSNDLPVVPIPGLEVVFNCSGNKPVRLSLVPFPRAVEVSVSGSFSNSLIGLYRVSGVFVARAFFAFLKDGAIINVLTLGDNLSTTAPIFYLPDGIACWDPTPTKGTHRYAVAAGLSFPDGNNVKLQNISMAVEEKI